MSFSEIVSIASDVCGILTFTGVIIAVASFFKNRLCKRHLKISVALGKKYELNKNDDFFSQSVRIDLINKTSKKFYILSTKLYNGKSWAPVFHRLPNNSLGELTCVPIDSYEPKILYALITTPAEVKKGDQIKIEIKTTFKTFVFRLKYRDENYRFIVFDS